MNRFLITTLARITKACFVAQLLVFTLAAQPADLFISEYIEGTGNNKALEIYNGTSNSVNLNGYLLQLYSNGATTPNVSLTLFGTLTAGDVFVIGRTDASRAIVDAMDIASNGLMSFDGNDVLVLRKGGANGTILDVIGQIGQNPGTSWGSNNQTTADNTLRRRKNICKGDADGSNTFDPVLEWEFFGVNVTDGLGQHAVICGQIDEAPQVVKTLPLPNSSGIASNSNITITFSEAVLVANRLGNPAGFTEWFAPLCGY